MYYTIHVVFGAVQYFMLHFLNCVWSWLHLKKSPTPPIVCVNDGKEHQIRNQTNRKWCQYGRMNITRLTFPHHVVLCFFRLNVHRMCGTWFLIHKRQHVTTTNYNIIFPIFQFEFFNFPHSFHVMPRHDKQFVSF